MIATLDGGWSTTREAEHALHELAARLGLAPSMACTHFRPDPGRVVVSIDLDGVPPELQGLQKLHELRAGRVGEPPGDREGWRAFVFAGSDQLTGVLTIGELLAGTAISEVVALGGLAVPADALLNTQGFVRPVFRRDRLLLAVRPARGGLIVPFEQPNPTPCCAAHA